MMYYRRIHEPKEGEEIQYLAVYALRWPWDSGVDPTDAFVKADDPLLKAAPLMLEACKMAELLFVSIFDVYDVDTKNTVRKLRAAIAAAEKKEE